MKVYRFAEPHITDGDILDSIIEKPMNKRAKNELG